jgi:hypothetical protein
LSFKKGTSIKLDIFRFGDSFKNTTLKTGKINARENISKKVINNKNIVITK